MTAISDIETLLDLTVASFRKPSSRPMEGANNRAENANKIVVAGLTLAVAAAFATVPHYAASPRHREVLRYRADRRRPGKQQGTNVAGTQFDMVTPGNEMKWGTTEPSNGSYNFGPGGRIVSFAQAHNMRVRGHKVYSWDVVNDPFSDDGNSKLYLNDYNIEGENTKSNALYALAKSLRCWRSVFR